MNSKVQISFKEKQGFDDKKPNWNALRTKKHIPRPINPSDRLPARWDALKNVFYLDFRSYLF